MSTSTSSAPQSTSSSSNSVHHSSFQLGPGYILGFFGVLGVLFLLGVASAWRGIVIRRRRLALGLPEEGYFRAAPPEISLDPPVMHSVQMLERGYEGLSWTNIFPVSSTILTQRGDDPNDSYTYLHPGPFSSLAELLPSLQRGFRRNRHRKTSTYKLTEKELSQIEKAPRRLVTSVLIAMPSTTPRRYQTACSAYEAGEALLPEVVLGISDHEVLWPQEKGKGLL